MIRGKTYDRPRPSRETDRTVLKHDWLSITDNRQFVYGDVTRFKCEFSDWIGMTLNRRSVLALSVSFCGGCLGTLKTDTRSGTIQSQPITEDGEATAGELRYVLEEQVTVEKMFWSGDRIAVEYIRGSSEKHTPAGEVSYITKSYVDHVYYDGRGTRLEVTVLDTFGDPVGTWYVKREWANRFNEKSVTWDTLIAKVFQTTSEA